MFGASVNPTNAGEEIYPGYPGLVLAGGDVRTMTWGFPLSLTGKSGQKLKPKPVNNARADKLDSFMWRYSFAERRCLIPMTAVAEAEGAKGGKTRTWISLPDQPVFTVAGIWRESDEWGPVYSMVMTEECIGMQGIHDRSPVIIAPNDRAQWQDGALEEARALCTPYGSAMHLDRTNEPWVRR
ncbi:SOS response-associated peptidase [Croceicoccus marinus]|uniref:Abasic site processing protein n=1 Tax=Croceicoccus marinus TaxID=450378 RepID=A0A7G6VZR0_9SPHN|nr:SOS response-associated peptidase family protein [Croceicoccus marinus]